MAEYTMQQLEVFFAIVENHSLSGAARQLYISQPSLSKTLSRLEENLGVRLFHRKPGSLSLTTEGEVLYERLKYACKTMNQAIEEARYAQSHQSRSLRIGLHVSLERSREFSDVWDVLDAYESANSDVQVTEALLEYDELRDALLAGELDAIITHDFTLRTLPNLSERQLRPLRFYLAISPRHPLAQEEPLDFRKLNGESFFYSTPENNRQNQEFAASRVKEIGVENPVMVYAQNIRSAAKAVVRGKGVMITCHSHGFGPEELKLIPIQQNVFHTSLSCAWLGSNRKRELQVFLQLLSTYVRFSED